MQLVCSIDPGVFRVLDDLLSSETRGQGQLELLSLMDVAEGDEAFNDLSEEKEQDWAKLILFLFKTASSMSNKKRLSSFYSDEFTLGICSTWESNAKLY